MKCRIYDAVKAALPRCNSWTDLCERLAGQGIGVNFKLDRRNGRIIGVSFTKDGVSFSGLRVDRSIGFYRLDRLFGSRVAEGVEWKLRLQDSGFDERRQPILQDAANTFIGQPSPDGTTTDDNCGGTAESESKSDIIQVGIGALIELCVQSHQTRVSFGGGGGGNESGWGDNDNEKDKHNPRRKRR